MRVLIVSPHFPPVNAADMQRVRMLLPYLHEYGINAEILAVESAQVACGRDQWLVDGLPPDVPVHRVHALRLRWAKIPGLGTLGFRALRAIRKRGDELLASKRFDLIYFSTTVFEVHVLGPRWKKKFGVPFIMDYQDPWVNDYYREHPNVLPPGGRIKYAAIDFIHRHMEPAVLRHCAGITAVSPAYPPQLARRYPQSGELPALVMPFPGDPLDLQRAGSSHLTQSIFQADDGLVHWVYAGVVIPAMHGTLRALFRALAESAEADLLARLRLHFIGTNYGIASQAQPVVAPIAAEYGLQSQLREHPARIAYSEMLVCLRQAHALLVIGSDDAGYTASKVYPYLLARRPLLTLFHQDSSIVTLLNQVRGGVCVPFGDVLEESALAATIADLWLTEQQHARVTPLDETAFASYLAPSQAKSLCKFLKSIIPS